MRNKEKGSEGPTMVVTSTHKFRVLPQVLHQPKKCAHRGAQTKTDVYSELPAFQLFAAHDPNLSRLSPPPSTR